MKELLEYRVFLVNRLRKAAQEFCEASEALDPLTKIHDEWNLHQIAVHTRDVNKLVYDMRARRTIAEESPLFENFEPEEWMAAHYDKSESMKNILEQFKLNVDELCGILSALPVEAWSRESRHDIIGDGLPSQLWVERGLAHIEEHLVEIKNHQ